jgi:hypothetical protein
MIIGYPYMPGTMSSAKDTSGNKVTVLFLSNFYRRGLRGLTGREQPLLPVAESPGSHKVVPPPTLCSGGRGKGEFPSKTSPAIYPRTYLFGFSDKTLSQYRTLDLLWQLLNCVLKILSQNKTKT